MRNESWTRRRPLGALAATLMVLSALALAPWAQGSEHIDPEAAADDPAVERIAGGDRAGTAAEIALEVFDTAEVAIITRFDHEIDALASGFLAGCLGAPVLLTWTDPVTVGGETHDVHPDTLDALETLGVGTVVILGGELAISAEVEAALDEDYATERVAGDFREDTAQEIAEYEGCEVGTTQPDDEDQRTAIVARRDTARPESDSSIDALAAGGIAFDGGFPILLTGPDVLAPQASDALENLEIDRVLIIGGTTAISPLVQTQLEAEGYDTERIAGEDRWRTAAEVADFAVDELGWDRQAVALTRSEHMGDSSASSPDAMTSAPFTGTHQTPVLLATTLDGSALHGATEEYLEDHAVEIVQLIVFGGVNAVPQAVVDAATGAATADAPAAATAAPELVAANHVRTDEGRVVVRYVFDEPLDAVGDHTAFHLHTGDGENIHAEDAEDAELDPDRDEAVLVTFELGEDATEAGDALDEVTVAAVDAGAVLGGEPFDDNGEDGDFRPNPEGSVALAAGGATAAPVLTTVTLEREEVDDEETVTVTYVFDKDLTFSDDDQSFALYDAEGNRFDITAACDDEAEEADANWVVCTFGEGGILPFPPFDGTEAPDEAILGGVAAGSVAADDDAEEAAVNHAASEPVTEEDEEDDT